MSGNGTAGTAFTGLALTAAGFAFAHKGYRSMRGVRAPQADRRGRLWFGLTGLFGAFVLVCGLLLLLSLFLPE